MAGKTEKHGPFDEYKEVHVEGQGVFGLKPGEVLSVKDGVASVELSAAAAKEAKAAEAEAAESDE